MVAVLDGDDLLVRHEFEALALTAGEVVLEGYAGAFLNLATGNPVGIELDLDRRTRTVNLDKNMDRVFVCHPDLLRAGMDAAQAP